jgi:hypothetical protein
VNQPCQKILLAGAFGVALAACSSTGTSYDHTTGNSNAGITSSGTSTTSGTTTSGASVRTTPPPNGSTSNGGVIDDRINGNPDVPGTNR